VIKVLQKARVEFSNKSGIKRKTYKNMQHILQINLYNFFAIVQKNCAGGTLKKKNISNPNFSYRVHHFVQICRFAD
jgi:hypothetical protein